jgi:hypothetical protein
VPQTQFTLTAGRASLQLKFNPLAIAASDDRLFRNHTGILESIYRLIEFDTKLRRSQGA